MVNGLMWLLGCQLLGEALVRVADVPVPGPVVGMVVLLLLLRVRRVGEGATVVRAADGLLRHLQLLFVPTGVGVIAYAGVVRDEAWPILVGLVGSWLVALVLVGWTAQLLARGHHGPAPGPATGPTGAGAS